MSVTPAISHMLSKNGFGMSVFLYLDLLLTYRMNWSQYSDWIHRCYQHSCFWAGLLKLWVD